MTTPLDAVRVRLGVDRVRTDDATRAAYGRDTTENPDGMPEAIVAVNELDELREIVRLAAAARIPLVPRVAGTNLGGLAIPSRGGWVVDLAGMNRIVDIDLDDRIAVIEPGVTFIQLRRTLDELSPRLTIGYPLSPPETSIVANCLLDGLGNLSLRHGSMGEWICGLEAVRADGSIVRTGAWAAGVPPFGRAPLPDLTGLFVSWHGTTGIASKLAVELWPVQPFRERSFVLAYDRAVTLRALRELPALDVLDDLGGLSWPIAKLLFGVAHPRERDPGEPEFFFYVDLSAATRALFDAKRAAVRDFIRGLRRDGLRVEDPIDVPTLVRLEPRLAQLAEFPTRLDFLLDHPDGGLTWVGTYGPLSRFDAACSDGIAVVERHGFPPAIVARPMKGGHFAVLRFIQLFRRADVDDRERVRRCNAELCDVLHRHGFVMYKTPAWAIDRYRPHFDPGFARLVREMHDVLDPDRIMNPGRWEL